MSLFDDESNAICGQIATNQDCCVQTQYRLLSQFDHGRYHLIDISNSFAFILTEIELGKKTIGSYLFIV